MPSPPAHALRNPPGARRAGTARRARTPGRDRATPGRMAAGRAEARLRECSRSARRADRVQPTAPTTRSRETGRDRRSAADEWSESSFPSGIYQTLRGPKFHHETASIALGLVPQSTAVRPQNRARNVEPDTAGVSAALERLEQF